jgi:hypothetical protein
MRYVTEVSVDLPRESALRLLAERDIEVCWRPDLEMCEPIAGEPGLPGAQTRLLYRQPGGGGFVKRWSTSRRTGCPTRST